MFHLFGQPQKENKATFQRLKIFVILIWLALFTGGMIGHQGSLFLYTLFSAVLTIVLISGLYRQSSYGYLFLVVFFWMGFWLKLTVHNLFQYDYVEPIGRFDGSSTAWDEALLVPTIAGIGILLGRWLYSFVEVGTVRKITADSSRVPCWYPSARRTIWGLLMVTMAGLAAINIIYGIQQSGLTPRNILMWPLNALIYWLLSTGLSMAIATILWWDVCLKRSISWSIYAVFTEAFLSTMSLLSRGLFVFHLIPPLVALFQNKNLLNWSSQKQFIRILAVLTVFFIISISMVSTARSYLYQQGQDFRTTTLKRLIRFEVLQGKIPAVEEMIRKNEPLEKQLPDIKSHGLRKDIPLPVQVETLKMEQAALEQAILQELEKTAGMLNTPSGQLRLILSEFAYQMTGGFLDRISALAVDRWIGMEGAMAASSYPGKDSALFMGALTENSKGNHTSLYQTISQSIYQASDTEKYRFASLPGAAAFLYFSGSLWFVLLGMFGLVFLLLAAEHLTHYLTRNVILCALVGMNAANAISQLGIVPRQLLIHFGMIFASIFLIWLIQLRSSIHLGRTSTS